MPAGGISPDRSFRKTFSRASDDAAAALESDSPAVFNLSL